MPTDASGPPSAAVSGTTVAFGGMSYGSFIDDATLLKIGVNASISSGGGFSSYTLGMRPAVSFYFPSEGSTTVPYLTAYGNLTAVKTSGTFGSTSTQYGGGAGAGAKFFIKQNIAFGLKRARLPRKEIKARVAEMVALVRLEGDDLSSNASRLVEEAHTVPLFGGKRAIWINPEPEAIWPYRQSVQILREIMADRMVPLTIEGLERAMRELSR